MAGYIGTQAVSVNTTSATITGDASIGGDLSLGDSDKAIFGAGSDLQIYHNGSYSVIKEAGTGDLEIQTNGSEVQLTGNAGTDYMLRAISNGAVKLYYDNALKVETTSTGALVTGHITASGTNNIYVGDNGKFIAGGGPA